MLETEFRLPAEWEPQAGVLLAWPHSGTDWAERLAEVEATYVALITAILRFQPAIVCVADGAVRRRAEQLLKNAINATARLRFVEIDYDDTWLRDSGPITLRCGERFRLLDFRFTGWGGKFEGGRDDKLVAGLVERDLFRHAEHCRIDWALEGGAIESDGKGDILTTWRCLNQRHPQESRAELTRMLSESLRARRVLWLDHGYLQGDDTDAHIDTLVRYAPHGGIVYQGCDDPADPHYAELRRMAADLADLRDAKGQAYRLFALPWPAPIKEDDGRRLAASYANFLIVDGAVLMPAYGDAADRSAQAVLAEAFPDREIVPVPCRSLIWQNGSLHCVTMQLPAGVLNEH